MSLKKAAKPKEANWKQRNREAYAPKQEVLSPEKPYKPWQFQPGHEPLSNGRPVGSENKIPRILKELIMMAAEIEGADGEGTDGALGYIRMMARDDRKTFAGLLRAIIPLQINTGGEKENMVYRSVEEVRAELEEQGISPETLRQLMIENIEDEDDQS